MQDAGCRARDLARDERYAAPGRFVVEQNPTADEEAVGIAVVLAQLVGKHLGAGIRAARPEQGVFVLRRRRRAEHFAGRGLIQPAVCTLVAHCLEQPQSAHCYRVGCVVRHVEADPHVTLRAQIVDFRRLDGLNDVVDRTRVVEIAKDQAQAVVGAVRILIDAIDTFGVERA